MDDDRIIDLEVKLAYQERLIRELDGLVRSFGDRLDAALHDLDQVKKGVASQGSSAPQQKPPHY